MKINWSLTIDMKSSLYEALDDKDCDEFLNDIANEISQGHLNGETELNDIVCYRVGLANDYEHIDYFDYNEDEFEEALAMYDSLIVGKGEYKYLYSFELDKNLLIKED